MTVTDKAYKTPGGCTAALGTFDGVHLGHRHVLQTARQFGLPAVVVTFAQNPQSVLRTGEKRRIFSTQTANAIFEELGVSGVIRFDFNDIRDMEPDAFLDKLVQDIGAKNIVCGFNFRFGKGAAGDADIIVRYGRSHGIGVRICDAVTFGGDAISSTRIRRAIEQGDLDTASKMLGRGYSIDFPVSHGDARGRTIGFPTANQIYEEEFVVPRFGVYASRATVCGRTYPSITNVGVRPTFLSPVVLAETYLDGFQGNLYDARVAVHLLRHLRDEVKFDSLDELKAQIASDLAQSKNEKRTDCSR